MICDFTSFSKVFQSYQNGWLVVLGFKISPRAGLEPGTNRSVGQRLSSGYCASGAPLFYGKRKILKYLKEKNNLK